MFDVAIRVTELGKQYRLGITRERYYTFREALIQLAQVPFQRFKKLSGRSGNEREMFWALKDVSFEVKHGEVVGIIGRNGAGKSTLLKILSRITEPTEGRVELFGRIGSLLEVGTGFHPELTGRENIYLNGAILGMKKAEIERKFDEIVDFSEIGQFLDTPVKRYSSGMYIRLAFAVAAHLEPEVLVVDEVLAVGDVAFQKKCLGKMGDVAKQGRTVLFVSHNMKAISKLCTRTILLEHGKLVMQGNSDDVIQAYLSALNEGTSFNLDERRDRFDGTRLRFTQISLADTDGNPVEFLQTGNDGKIILHYRSPTGEMFKNVIVCIHLKNQWGDVMLSFQTNAVSQNFDRIGPRGKFICEIPRLPLKSGMYLMTVYVNVNGYCLDEILEAVSLQVEAGHYFESGEDPRASFFYHEHHWSYEAEC